MASETTELTFVRCPSCRSLVPASAARCRICNSPLENGAKAEDSDANKNASRVRQNTMSADPNEVASAIAKAQQENVKAQSAPSAPEPSGSANAGSMVDTDIDPLGAYLQEGDESSSGSDAGADPLGLLSDQGEQDSVKKESSSPNPFVDDFGDDDSWGIPPTQKQADKKNDSASPFFGAKESEQGGAGFAAPQGADASRERSNAPQKGPSPAFPRSNDERRAPGGGAPRIDRDKGQENRPPRDRNDGRNAGSQHQSPRREEPRREQPKREEQRPVPKQAERTAPEAQKGEVSKIFGWLVSFKTAEGQATELRQGRFFVTSSSIKASDLVIEDPSISTPHALMAVNPERGVQVQDLMSEQGIFVRRAGEGEYKREEGTVALRHGDWLKFGRVEYLVALLPYAQK